MCFAVVAVIGAAVVVKKERKQTAVAEARIQAYKEARSARASFCAFIAQKGLFALTFA
ncbi:MAG: hypothetical protein ACLUFV_10930 [Acutalibacteraceae bacterium]